MWEKVNATSTCRSRRKLSQMTESTTSIYRHLETLIQRFCRRLFGKTATVEIKIEELQGRKITSSNGDVWESKVTVS